ncbi:hypothetical protein ACFL47_03265 [Candidatus Latescibacterota bacterium]
MPIEKRTSREIGWGLAASGAALNYGAYFLVLWAYQLSSLASTIAAFRQISIIVGVVLAFTIYHEKGLLVRLSGAILITCGLILIGIYG